MFNNNAKTETLDDLTKKFYGGKPAPDITSPESIAMYGRSIYEAQRRYALAMCLEKIKGFNPSLNTLIADMQSAVDTNRAESEKVAGIEKEMYRLTAKRDELSATGDFSPQEFGELGTRIEAARAKLNAAVKLVRSNDALRSALNAASRQVSTLRVWQTDAERGCGGIELGNWAVSAPATNSGANPAQTSRRLLSLADHALMQCRLLADGKMPRLNRSAFGFSKRQISIPFLQFTLNDDDQ